MHPLVEYLISLNVPMSTVHLLLLLPVVVTLVAAIRQVVGIKGFGIYTPAIITYAFLAFGEKGLKYGIALFLTVIVVGFLGRYMLRPFRLLYLPRVAITLTLIMLGVLVVLAVGGSMQRTGLAAADIFPLLIIITLGEKFIAAQIENGEREAIILTLETLLISIVGYFFLSSEWVRSFTLSYPWWVFFTLPINIFLGRFAGLRVTEYIRFRNLIREL